MNLCLDPSASESETDNLVHFSGFNKDAASVVLISRGAARTSGSLTHISLGILSQ